MVSRVHKNQSAHLTYSGEENRWLKTDFNRYHFKLGAQFMFMNLVQRASFFPLLTLEHSVAEDSIISVRVLAQVNVESGLQFPRILRLGQVLNQGNNPIGHRCLCQSLVHHILAPIVLQEARSDKQNP